jgi:protein-tyrosine phosphatase
MARTFLLLLVCLASCNLIRPPRHVDLDGQSNFRDVGGYRTEDGGRVQWGQIYRSGTLATLSERDVDFIQRLGVRTVVDFRTEQEIEERGADRLPDRVNHIVVGISGDGLAEAAHEARSTGDFTKLPATINPEIHRLLVKEAKEQYAELLRTATDPANRPLVFHCSHGVHRTGTGTAILLSALGVPWKTVRKDYLLSNKFRKKEVNKRIRELRELTAKNTGVSVRKVDDANIKAFYRLKASYIDATRDEILKEYGSTEAFVIEGLGLSAEELAALRLSLLQ